ncbi:hypothetical protein Trydic_g12579 [Trypoxylus dichotomus]
MLLISEGRGLVNFLINKLPVELILPSYQYCGPGTKLEERLQRDDPGINPLDRVCKDHDIVYSQSEDLQRRHEADRVLEERAWKRVKSADNHSDTKKWRFLPLIPLFARLAGGTAGIAQAVNKAKAAQKELEEAQRHDGEMEDIGYGIIFKPEQKKPLSRLLPRALTNVDSLKFGKKYLPSFRGVFMRDGLPQTPEGTECVVVDLDSVTGPGTHWVAYYKQGSTADYYDSHDNLKSPKELLRYFRKYQIPYNHDTNQNYDDINCGYLCLEFLYNNYIYIEGTFKPDTTGTGSCQLTNNAYAFLFDQVHFEINGVEVDRSTKPGITSTIKADISYSDNESESLEIAGWSPNSTTEPTELILLRSENDLTCYKNSDADGTKTASFDLEKIEWDVPHVAANDEIRLKQLKTLNSNKTIFIPFRKWELYELPYLSKTKTDIWHVKTSTDLEKARYVMVAFQTNRKDNLKADAPKFDHAVITNLKTPCQCR